jgi:membrane fusion protein (multidrug efflux system)
VKRIPPWVIIIVIIAALAVIKLAMHDGSAAGPGLLRSRGGGGGGPTPVDVEVVKSERMADRVTSVGTVLPDERVDVRSEISGRVREIHFREGTRVARGDLLVKIDDSELRAQLARAESHLLIAQKDADRERDLYDQHVASQREFDTAVNNLGVAKAEHDLIRAQLDKTDIRAPFSGLVGLRSVSVGTYVSPATPITMIQNDHPVKIDFTVPERYAASVAKGDSIHFTVEGSTRVFGGTVYALESDIDAQTRTMGVRATSPNADGALVPGAFAEVEVILPARDTILVPSFAVIPELRGHRVFVCRGGKAESRSIRIGVRTEERVEVVDGLAAGDTLITSGILQLKPGAPVSVTAVE